MGWFWNRKKSGTWDLGAVTRPWTDGPSIYGYISNHIASGQAWLPDGGETLPDEKDDGEPKWVAGGLDGAMGHHAGVANEKSRAKMLHRALGVVLEDLTETKLSRLYEQVLQERVLEYVDSLIERIIDKQDLDAERLEAFALWLAKNSPDREAVKLAITLLGILPESDHTELLMTLGRHEEFTLYAAVALSNQNEGDAEKSLFSLAQHVAGWGRIQIVERLADTQNPEIKSWMLREGYKNSVMPEYLAYTCASAGGLRDELAKDAVDDTLLAGAGDIIETLTMGGGPAEDMDDYDDGASVVERYLHHIGTNPTDIERLIVVNSIAGYLEEDIDWADRAARGWVPERRRKLLDHCIAIKTLPHWQDAVDAGLNSNDNAIFRIAARAASILGIDTWEHHFQRLKSGDGKGWGAVMQTKDPDRIDQVIALAEEKIPLDKVATGPAEVMGLGLEWANHHNLDWILQDLGRFPGKGWPLIRAGIRSPVVRNRVMALRALSPWGKPNWPGDAEALLQKAEKDEPDDELREDFEVLLAGREIAVKTLGFDVE